MTLSLSGGDLRNQREQAGLDVREVADLTGLPAAFIELLESGKHSAPTYAYRVKKAIATFATEGDASVDQKRGHDDPSPES
ncbi:helix-turn-helix domain-containing protein [Leucobacter chromiiresistens]|uniref:Helix-turn-helix domain-containing protein n=1 Tax=Leucobacter chromiiresistens TaxID=1079994 RepID=A0A1H1BLV1_9MICO|nr:helix-turn-helix domain-containing protein [Leucobacter chromiiresistens]SDQ52917.1 Helix-turn-helix domain-containing protein [Leucobacter chromiiresistens]